MKAVWIPVLVVLLCRQAQAASILVTNTAPANAAVAVAVDSNIVACFSDAIDGTTVTTERFILHGGQCGFRNGAVTTDVTRTRATLDPTGDSGAGERLFAALTGGILASNSVDEVRPHAWSFRTAVDSGNGELIDGGQSPGTNNCHDVSLGDLNGDGWLDAFILNHNQEDEVWMNDAHGVLFEKDEALGSGNSQGVALGDVDDDGDLDAYVVVLGATDALYLNNGNGVFSDSGQSLVANDGRAARLNDLDGDGALDVFVARDLSFSRVWTNDGSGVFSSSGQALNAGAARDVAIGDVNGDGFLDAFVAAIGGNTLWTNNEFGVFGNSGQSVGTNQAWGVELGDLNGDGWLDAFVVNDSGQGNTVWTNNGAGVFFDSGQSLGTNSSRDVVLGDFDADGDLDAFVGNKSQADRLWLNDGAAGFTDSGKAYGNGSTRGVAAGDVDRDGDLDVLAAVYGGPCKLWLGCGAHRIRVSCGDHGTLSPATDVVIPHGATTNFVVSSDVGFHIEQLLTNGTAVTAAEGVSVYTSVWANVTAPGALDATFVRYVEEILLCDSNGNGKYDRVRITIRFDAGMANGILHAISEAATLSHFTVTDSGSGNPVTVLGIVFVSGDGADAVFELILDETDPDLGTGTAPSLDVVYDGSGGDLIITDGVNPEPVDTIASGVVERDDISPLLLSVSSDGQTFTTPGTVIITLTFSEPVVLKPGNYYEPDYGFEYTRSYNVQLNTNASIVTTNGATPTFTFPVPDNYLGRQTIFVKNFDDASGNPMTRDFSHSFFVNTASDGDIDSRAFVYPDILRTGPDWSDFLPGADCQRILRDANGKLVFAACLDGLLPNKRTFDDAAVCRLNPDGTLDATFSPGGTDGNGVACISHSALRDAPFPQEGACALAFDSDENIVVGGVFFPDGWEEGFVCRFDEQGNMDTRFGTNGLAFFSFQPGAIGRERLYGLAVHTGGTERIALVGAWEDVCGVVLMESDGSLVTGFGSNGVVSLPLADYSAAFAVAFDAGSNIVVVGSSGPSSTAQYFTLCRLDQTGAFDATFGDGGKVVMDGVSTTELKGVIRDIAIDDATGNIIVFGSKGQKYIFARFDPAGMLDSGFGSNGVTRAQARIGARASQMVIQDGKIWGAGVSGVCPAPDVVRLNAADGSLDTSFGSDDATRYDMVSDGMFNTNRYGSVRVAEAEASSTYPSGHHPAGMAVEPDGSAVVFAKVDPWDGSYFVRLQSDGTIDTSISQPGAGGTFELEENQVHRILQRSDGRYVAVGEFPHPYMPLFSFLKMDKNGVLDPDGDFGTMPALGKQSAGATGFEYFGRLTTLLEIPGTWAEYDLHYDDEPEPYLPVLFHTTLLGAAIAPDNKIVVVGSTRLDGVPSNDGFSYVARFNEDGSIDTTFSADNLDLPACGEQDDIYFPGVRLLNTTPTAWRAGTLECFLDVEVLPDGSILAAGRALATTDPQIPAYAYTFWTLAKFDANGDPDPSFGQTDFDASGADSNLIQKVDGVSLLILDNIGTDNPREILLQPDGKIIVAGFASHNAQQFFMTARFDANGTLDPSFSASDGDGVDGVSLLDLGGQKVGAFAAELQPDGKILLVGTKEGTSAKLAVARLDGDGHLDGSFGVSGGYTITDVTTAYHEANLAEMPRSGIVLQPDGKFLVVLDGLKIVRFTANGMLDATFGVGGEKNHSLDRWMTDAVLLPDWSVLVAGRGMGDTNGVLAKLVTTNELSYLQSWRLKYFGTTENTGDAANLADPDGDNRVNLFEYAFDCHPWCSDLWGLPQWQFGSNSIGIAFTEPVGIDSITYGADYSFDLLTGDWYPIPDTGIGMEHLFEVLKGTNRAMFVRQTVTAE